MTKNEENIIAEALNILETRLRNDNEFIRSSKDAADFLTLKLAAQQREVFAMMAFTSRLQLIEYRELFFGTIDQANIYPREVVKAALNANAVAVIIAHNHPSGNPEPSDADYRLTHSLKDILDVLDIKLADHIVIGAGRTTSFADQGLL